METFYQLMGVVGAGLIVWLMYRTVKGRPELFNRDSMHKSFSTMGLLALALIAFVALLVWMTK